LVIAIVCAEANDAESESAAIAASVPRNLDEFMYLTG
jgi:hypothetical protein